MREELKKLSISDLKAVIDYWEKILYPTGVQVITYEKMQRIQKILNPVRKELFLRFEKLGIPKEML